MIKTSEQIETDKLLLSCTGLWEEFHINKTKDPINVQEYYNLISNLLDQQLNHSRMWLSSPQAKEYYYAEMQRQKEILQSLDMEWDDLLEQTYESVDDLIERVYELGKQKGYNDIKQKLVFTDTDKEALDFVRQYNFHLIKKLSDDLRGSVKKTITQAVATGENPYSLANKIVELGVKPLEGSTLSAKQRAVMIAKTEVSRAQNTGILQSYVNEGYTEVIILTAEDSNVCSLCLDNAYLFNKGEDKVYHSGLKDNVHRISDLDKDSILPLHPNCRCTYLSVWDSKNSNVEPYTVNLTPLTDSQVRNNLNNTYTKYTPNDKLGLPNADAYTIEVQELTDKELFLDKLKKAAASQPADKSWRVDIPDDISFFDNCRMFITKNGSTIAIRDDGDIISVCANNSGNVKDRSSSLLKFATTKGGTKLDSFEGNYEFYRHCGFEPVTHVEFNEDYAPPGWIKERDDLEHVIFFEYTGRQSRYEKPEQFYEAVSPVTGDDAYDKAYTIRDENQTR